MNVDVKLLFFAKAREIVGKSEDILKVPQNIKNEILLNIIIEKFQLSDIKSNVVLALNGEFCDQNDELNIREGDEVAIIPPLSGG